MNPELRVKDPALFDLEKEAKAARRGLWATDGNVPPWEWRETRRQTERVSGLCWTIEGETKSRETMDKEPTAYRLEIREGHMRRAA